MVREKPREPTLNDPLDKVLAPPSNETEEERHQRLQREMQAKEISDAIDGEIEAERIAEKKTPKPVKVLLLGEFVRNML